MPVAVTASPVSPSTASRPLLDLATGQVRRAGDGWHAVLRIDAVDHRVWSKEPPSIGAHYVAELSFDGVADLNAWADVGTRTSTSDPGTGTVLPAKRHASIPYAGKERR